MCLTWPALLQKGEQTYSHFFLNKVIETVFVHKNMTFKESSVHTVCQIYFNDNILKNTFCHIWYLFAKHILSKEIIWHFMTLFIATVCLPFISTLSQVFLWWHVPQKT